uniref:Putative ovule protein n=1 Tax=Solanum chacoense TaxID=4108 RepID=A0A0V0IDR0_SOLCH
MKNHENINVALKVSKSAFSLQFNEGNLESDIYDSTTYQKKNTTILPTLGILKHAGRMKRNTRNRDIIFVTTGREILTSHIPIIFPSFELKSKSPLFFMI